MRRTALSLLIAALAAGCGSSSGKLVLSTGIASRAAAVGALAAGSGIEVTRVRIAVAEIKLQPTGSDKGGSGADEVVAGPYLIDLSGTALAGGLTQVFDVGAQPGTYRHLKFRIHKLEGGDPASPAMSGLSIAVDGTIDGAEFHFQSALDEEQDREGSFQISSAGDNVTLSIDPSGWFVGEGGGARIDPREAATSGSLRARIEANIKASIDAFEDDDRNGERD
jgi:hypothetical protein